MTEIRFFLQTLYFHFFILDNLRFSVRLYAKTKPNDEQQICS